MTASTDSCEYRLCARPSLSFKLNINKSLYSFILLSFRLYNFCTLSATCLTSMITLCNCFQCAFCETVPVIVLIPSPLKTFGFIGDSLLRGSILFPSVKHTLLSTQWQSTEVDGIKLAMKMARSHCSCLEEEGLLGVASQKRSLGYH